MNNHEAPQTKADAGSPENREAALFASMVMQQANMALMLLGRIPDPEGKTSTDLESASVFIDTLEMLSAKTKGNLDPGEREFLQGTLTNLRMAFVEAVNSPASEPSPAASGSTAPAPIPELTEPSVADDARKKFVKKY